MADLGSAWHVPGNPEPRGRAGMRDPVGAIVPGTAVTIVTGNQFQGQGGKPGNQLQAGSSLFFKTSTETTWRETQLTFLRAVGDNKYYSAAIPKDTFQTGDVAQYYLRIPYSDHYTTFVRAEGDSSATTADENEARAAPFTFIVESAAVRGQWAPVISLPNVAIHASVLPNGRVLMWGRRDRPEDSLDVHECTPFVWNPDDGTITNTPQPKRADGVKVNLFCSGHAFLPDGRLLVVGGHQEDSDGLSQACLYDATTNSWSPTAPMTTPAQEEVRRWYPTATTLPDGSVLVLSGSYKDPNRAPNQQIVLVDLLQIWAGETWRTIRDGDGNPLNFIGLPLYPRMHVAADGQVFMSGTNDRTLLLKTSSTSSPGRWTEVALRAAGNRDYCPSVMYDVGQVIYLGGGNNTGTHAPTAETEIIDLGDNPPRWQTTSAMAFPRRQHNGVLLPDGGVLVLGGTRGGGGPNRGFNDLGPGQPVHVAEMWSPATGEWTQLAAEQVDRCYHSTAVLLPDGRVLSAGGGEYRPDDVTPNDPEDSHRDAQIFSPPYLFRGPRPSISSVPGSVTYGTTFEVGTAQPADVSRVSWIRLPSVTHSFDENQRINVLQFEQGPGQVTVTAPASANVCPPGHYMLFLLNAAGVPSVARIIQIQSAVPPAAVDERAEFEAAPVLPEGRTYLQVYAREATVATSARGTRVVVGITGTCPYGIGSCWGGAYEALGRLEGVDLVSPVPDGGDSTAEVFLEDEGLPALDLWDEQFHRIVNGTYEMRGVEVTLHGSIQEDDGRHILTDGERRPPVRLRPLAVTGKIQWDSAARAPKPLEEPEARAYENLIATQLDDGGPRAVTVIGPLTRTDGEYQLHVRLFER